MKQRAVWMAGLWLLGCGPKTEPVKSAEPAASATPAPSTEAPPPAAEPAPTPEPAPTSEPSAAKPQVPPLRDVCFAMCDRVKEKCPKNAFESCRLNCSKYDPPPEGCAEVVRAALSCARDATDLVCANVAPESCAKPFRQISQCASGKGSVATNEPTAVGLPPGFVVFESAAEGVHAPMPDGAAAAGKDVIATVKHSSGAVYSIRKLPRPEGKLNEKVFLKIGLNLLGRCSDKMKMQGMVDKPGRTSINYTTKCPDGSLEQGLFWATDKALFVASVHGTGDLGPTDAFLYGFGAK